MGVAAAAAAAGKIKDVSGKMPNTYIQEQNGDKRRSVRALQACYFILGMGLLAACCSIWQCMDYMKALYGHLHPSRVLSTCYNMMYMVVVFTLFFGGPAMWPNKRGRLLTGYGLYVFAIGVPPLIDTLCHRLLPAGPSLHALLVVWAVGAAVAGGADAIGSSVIYGQAAALGPAYTHAFLGGKAACGLTMAAIRCASKAALPGKSMHHLQLGTTVFLAVGALLVALCVVIVGWVLPRLQAGMEVDAIPPTLTVQQTLIASQSIALGSPVPPRASLLPFSNTLSAMQPGMDGAVLMPVFSASMQPTATGAMSFRLSRMDTHVGLQGHHTSRLLAPMGTLVPAWSNAHRASMRRRRTMTMHRPSSGSGRAERSGSADSGSGMKSPQRADSGGSAGSNGHDKQHQSPPGTRWQPGLNSSPPSDSHPASPHGKPTLQQVSESDHITLDTTTLSDSTPSAAAAAATTDSASGLSGQQASRSQAQASYSSIGSRPHSSTDPPSPRGGSFERLPSRPLAQTTTTSSGGGGGSYTQGGTEDSASRLPPVKSLSVSSPRSSTDRPGTVNRSHLESPLGGHFRDSIVPMRGLGHSPSADYDAVQSDDQLHHDSPFFMTQTPHNLQTVKEKEAMENLQEECQVSSPSFMESVRAVWLTMKAIYPFQLAAFVPPLITAAILPMIFALDYSDSVLGSWYVQVAAVTFQLGGFCGSALIPVPASIRYPKVTLLTASAAMLAFVGAFAAALKLYGGPITMIVLAFFMYMYSGYLNSCTFCLAGKGLLADDAQMVQMVLVLSTAVSFVVGGFISWAWLAVKV